MNEDMEPRMTSRTQAVLILERNLLPKMRLASFLKEEECLNHINCTQWAVRGIRGVNRATEI